ncbi:MAG: alpha/beta hydrolase family esterase [Panacagrimonas sp.]
MKNWLRAMPMVDRVFWSVGLLLAAGAVAFAVNLMHWGDANEAADARYASAAGASAECALGAREGRAGRFERRTPGGVPYTVVTPRNYQPGHVHPLLMVFAPASFSAGLTERYAGLTQLATQAGFVVAYAGSLQLSLPAVEKLSAVPAEVVAGWCIDPARVFSTGHSDGGTVTIALSALPQYQGRFAGIVASGVGWNQQDFADVKCPAPLPVTILHGAGDTHFPGFGRDAAQWWAACNRCTGQGAVGADACRSYTGCAAETVYCEPDRSHWHWAGDPEQVMAILERWAKAPVPAPAPATK